MNQFFKSYKKKNLGFKRVSRKRKPRHRLIDLASGVIKQCHVHLPIQLPGGRETHKQCWEDTRPHNNSANFKGLRKAALRQGL